MQTAAAKQQQQHAGWGIIVEKSVEEQEPVRKKEGEVIFY